MHRPANHSCESERFLEDNRDIGQQEETNQKVEKDKVAQLDHALKILKTEAPEDITASNGPV